MFAASQWIKRNLPDEAVLVGTGWWTPWDLGFLSGRDVANAEMSTLTLTDLKRPRYLVMRSQLLSTIESVPSHIAQQPNLGWLMLDNSRRYWSSDPWNIIQQTGLLLYEGEASMVESFSIYRWPVHESFAALDQVQAVDLDGLGTLASPPDDSMQATVRGNTMFPASMHMVRSVAMMPSGGVPPASLSVGPVHILPGRQLLFGFSPPTEGPVRLSLFAETDEERRLLWTEDVQPQAARPGGVELRTISLAEVMGEEATLSIQASSLPDGNLAPAFIYIGPVAVVSAPRGREMVRILGKELLENPSFEPGPGALLAGWQPVGNPGFDVSGRSSHGGVAAVHASSTSDLLVQSVAVRAGDQYLLSIHARATEGDQQARLQVNWHDSGGKPISASLEAVPVGPQWKRYEALVQAPAQAGTAIVYATPEVGSSVWYDDFSFAEVRHEIR
jgi:hypothetical protein